MVAHGVPAGFATESRLAAEPAPLTALDFFTHVDTHGVPATIAAHRELRARGQAPALPEAAVNLAFARFRQGSLFQRPCAREVAALVDEAQDRLRSDPEASLKLFERCRELQMGLCIALQGQHVRHLRLALGDRAGLVERERA